LAQALLHFPDKVCISMIRIACLGDSNTQGSGLHNSNDVYPAKLDEALKQNDECKMSFQTKRFGKGRALVRLGDSLSYLDSLEMGGGVVWAMQSRWPVYVLMLGTNDAKGGKISSKDELQGGFTQLLNVLRKSNAQATIFIVLPPGRIQSCVQNLRNLVHPAIREVASKHGAHVIAAGFQEGLDIWHDDAYQADGIHLSAEGHHLLAGKLAHRIAQALAPNPMPSCGATWSEAVVGIKEVNASLYHGNGYIVDKFFVITNQHVIEACCKSNADLSKCEVMVVSQLPSGTQCSVRGKVEWLGGEDDTAIIKLVKPIKAKPLPIGRDPAHLTISERVQMVSSRFEPTPRNDNTSVLRGFFQVSGEVNSVGPLLLPPQSPGASVVKAPESIWTNVRLGSGCSGAPGLDEFGNVIGIATSNKGESQGFTCFTPMPLDALLQAAKAKYAPGGFSKRSATKEVGTACKRKLHHGNPNKACFGWPGERADQVDAGQVGASPLPPPPPPPPSPQVQPQLDSGYTQQRGPGCSLPPPPPPPQVQPQLDSGHTRQRGPRSANDIQKRREWYRLHGGR